MTSFIGRQKRIAGVFTAGHHRVHSIPIHCPRGIALTQIAYRTALADNTEISFLTSCCQSVTCVHCGMDRATFNCGRF